MPARTVSIHLIALTAVREGTHLADKLHVAILNTVVNHLDVVTSTLVAYPVAASLAITLGRNGLEDILEIRPGFLVATRHQGRAVARTLFASGDAGAHETDALASTVLGTTVGVGEVGVTTIDDDVAALEERDEGLDIVVDSLASLDQQHHTARLLELGDEFLDGVGTDDGLALRLILEKPVDLCHGSVEGGNGEAIVCHVKDDVLSPGRCDIVFSKRRDSLDEGATKNMINLHDSKANKAKIRTS